MGGMAGARGEAGAWCPEVGGGRGWGSLGARFLRAPLGLLDGACVRAAVEFYVDLHVCYYSGENDEATLFFFATAC